MIRSSAGRHALRPLRPADALLLRVATWLNLNWCGDRLTFAQLDADPHLASYYHLALEDGDFGWVSADRGESTGVVWVKHFPAEAPGYGFVRAGVPELSVCVLPGYRRTGVGGALLEAAVGEGLRRGLSGLSLSVEEENPARRLYERLGFVTVTADASAATMFLDLTPVGRPD